MNRVLIIIICLTSVLISCTAVQETGDVYVSKGVQQYEDEEYWDAIETFKKAIELGGEVYDLEEIYTIIGNVYIDMGLYEEAIEYHKLSVETNKEYHKAWVNLGIAYRSNGQLDMAEQAYDRAIELNPDYAELRSSLGSLFILKMEPEKAIEEFEIAISLNPGIATTYGNAALAYAMTDDFDTAEKYLKQAKALGYENHKEVEKRINNLRE